MDFCFYSSRNSFYKNKFGAVAAGESLRLCLLMPRHFCVHSASLVICKDGEYEKKLSMYWAGMNGEDCEVWDVSFTLDEAGLYWYYFEYSTDFGTAAIKNLGNDTCSVNYGDNWQLTVYSPSFKTPDWLKGGIIYQIFPDRFFKSGKKKENVPSDRILRDDWGEMPFWKPDKNGKVLNNDYFCGDLKGIEKKLGYLSGLGVTCIYLNPIFEAHSNHRYNTADYMKIDPLLGTKEDFVSLCEKAKEKGIRIILDGVFSHTGDDSVYFNRYNRYDSVGAYNSEKSPYFSWYKFDVFPDEYKSWWGFDTLPEVREENESYQKFITGKGGVVETWLKAGASGFRLDVADELPDCFIDVLRKSVKRTDKNAVLIGEVWEDATNKESYGERRRYLLGDQLDSVMNYPFANAVLDFVRFGNAEDFYERVISVVENYPPEALNVLMNHIGTHDTERAITFLAGESCENRGRPWQATHKLSKRNYCKGVKLLKLAAVLQFTLPGVPSVYYGDEAGMQGYKDPFNRGCYPWGEENEELLSFYKKLCKLRKGIPALKDGKIRFVSNILSCVAFERVSANSRLLVIANKNAEEIEYTLPPEWFGASEVNGLKTDGNRVLIPPDTAAIFR
ncbi:MAG: glycoside hydrolase family 13 protein [Clostridia bacterium]|nr:glycoside hydrolase family 13 protein [Clostridia bacterium]